MDKLPLVRHILQAIVMDAFCSDGTAGNDHLGIAPNSTFFSTAIHCTADSRSTANVDFSGAAVTLFQSSGVSVGVAYHITLATTIHVTRIGVGDHSHTTDGIKHSVRQRSTCCIGMIELFLRADDRRAIDGHTGSTSAFRVPYGVIVPVTDISHLTTTEYRTIDGRIVGDVNDSIGCTTKAIRFILIRLTTSTGIDVTCFMITP